MNPRKRVRKVIKEPLKTMERRSRPRTKTKVSDQFNNTKKLYDPFVKNYKNYLQTLEIEAKNTITNIPAYVKEVKEIVEKTLIEGMKTFIKKIPIEVEVVVGKSWGKP